MNMENILVSIVIPAYNASNDIERCIESVLQQTYQYFEIIVVDDGSKDDTVEKVANIKKQYENDNIKLIRQQNSGPSKARNNGIGMAKGELIAFLDSDDEWNLEKLEKIVCVFADNPSLSVLGSLYSIGNKKIFKDRIGVVKKLSISNLLIKNHLITSATVCKTELLKRLKFNENQKYSEDYRLWLEICANGNECAVIQECLVKMCDKPIYGHKGLASRLWFMEKGELSNYHYLWEQNLIPFWQYFFACSISIVKYVKREILTLIK